MERNELFKKDTLYVICLPKEESKKELKDICVKHNIDILYEDIFTDEEYYPLYAVSSDGIGLIGGHICYLHKRNKGKIKEFHSLKEFEQYINIF